MSGKKKTTQHLSNVLETVSRESSRPTEATGYGSWLLGGVSEDKRRMRIRIQAMLTFVLAVSNLIGIGIAVVLVEAVPVPQGISDQPLWLDLLVVPGYIVVAFALGGFWLTLRTVGALRWAIEGQPPTLADQRDTFLIPLRFAVIHLLIWGCWAAILAPAYGLANHLVIPRILFAIGLCGVGVATSSYLFAGFALRPVAARALDAGPPPRRLASGIMGRTMTVWLATSAVPIAGMSLMAIFDLSLRTITEAEWARGVAIVSTATLMFGFTLTLILSWLTKNPVSVVRAALKRVELGDLRGDLVVFDGTELGELQRGFNSMVGGLRERERVRDLFGRHVGREVAAAAERELPKLGGEERHVAVIFIDIIGSTQLVTSRPPADVVQVLNRFFAIVVEEVDRHHGLVNKFAGDACLAIFGAPIRLESPEDAALAAARAMAYRLTSEMPDCQAGIGVAAGQAVAGNVGAKERFEYTVIGEPVNEAARLCELAKSEPGKLLASSATLHGTSEDECARWALGKAVTLRGLDHPTRLAKPAESAEPVQSDKLG